MIPSVANIQVASFPGKNDDVDDVMISFMKMMELVDDLEGLRGG